MKKLHLSFLVAAVILSASGVTFSQSSAENVSGPIPEWHHLDRVNDNYNGVSTEQAYELLKGKESETVIVAVIDSGLDIDHQDLQGSLWINEDEIAGNGIDDDKNGYVDDVYGWNFLGELEKDTYELTRVYKTYKDRFENSSEGEIAENEKEDYDYYLKLKKELEKQKASTQEDYNSWKPILEMYDRSYRLLTAYIDSDTLTLQMLKSVDSPDEKIALAVNFMEYLYSQEQFDIVAVRDYVDGLEFLLEYGYDPEYDQRSIVGDNYNDVYEKVYGNSYLNLTAKHGTAVAGIIGANRYNDLGGKGISDNVKIMGIRAVPDGDERDKDIANAIIYAVDNGAKIINMSFGKSYSPNKEAVDKAVKYAEEKGVLLVHAAGNSHKDVDVKDNFPSRTFTGSKKQAQNWLEIGASSWGDAENFVATFSNYGKETVDVFAPGVSIYSTVPGSLYDSQDGTSFAAPVVSGIAALIMSYYPNLTAVEVKEIILDSSIKFNKMKVNKPANYGAEKEEVKFSDLSITGGVVNAYEAIKMAEARKPQKEVRQKAELFMKNQVQLIAYVDRFSGGNLKDVRDLLQGPLKGVFGGIHILPFFYPIDGSDAGFDPIDHLKVDPKLGTWEDIRELSQELDIMADMIVNHVSSESPQYRDYLEKGSESEYSDMFLTMDKVFPKGASEEELLTVYRPRPGLPFDVVVFENGERKLVWTTFTKQQIDIDVYSRNGEKYLDDILEVFKENGIRMIRLDAVGYAVKKLGTSCFMIPESFDFISVLTEKARKLGMEVLVEIHSYYKRQIEVASKVDWVYDFALPPLVLLSFYRSSQFT